MRLGGAPKRIHHPEARNHKPQAGPADDKPKPRGAKRAVEVWRAKNLGCRV